MEGWVLNVSELQTTENLKRTLTIITVCFDAAAELEKTILL